MVHYPRRGERLIVAEHFSVVYDGPAMEHNRIPVTELAPALLAVSDLFMSAHRIIGGTTPPPALEVVAHREGSFDVELLLDFGNTAVDLFNTREALAAAGAVTLFTPVVGVLRWWQHRRLRGTEEVVTDLDPGTIRIRWPDGTHLEAPKECEQLVGNMDFRRSGRNALAPLDSNAGIETIAFQSHDDPEQGPVVMHREDAHELDRPAGEDVVIAEGERTLGLRPLKPSLERGYKWWVSDGSSRYWIEMHDLNFIARVENSTEAFTAGDVLRCRVRERQIQSADDGDLRVERIVLEVLEHLRMPPPEPLPGLEDD
jgi:hypothetical protein